MVISYLQFVSPILRLVDLETLATSLDILLITSWFLYTKAMGNRRSGGFPIFILQYQLLVQSIYKSHRGKQPAALAAISSRSTMFS